MPRQLTESHHALSLKYPSKLYYAGKDQAPSKNADNEFLGAT